MNNSTTISVTLSADLLNHLRGVAQSQHVPLNWLVVGLICDTIATWNEQVGRPSGVQIAKVGGLALSPSCH